MPLTSTSLVISNFALCGILFLAGFYLKDLILEIVSLDYVNLLGCSPRDPRSADSNPDEVDEFFQNVKILSRSAPGGTLSWVSRV